MSSEPSTSSLPICAVCGAAASGKRYGAVCCLGCIVFFRRTALRGVQYRCQRGGRCEITVETRCVCRSCRMQKCLEVGMSREAIQIRDVIGPRTRSSRSTPDTPKLDFNSILDLQRVQWTENQGEEEKQGVFMKNAYHRQATPLDINQGLSLAIQNSRDLINNLEIPNTRLSEASIAFMLIDQAFKTSREATDGFWLLQNGSYIGLHPDFKFEGQGDEAKEKCHFDFVTQLIDTIGKPFGTLEIDEMDCVMLKVLVLASDPSDLRDQCLKTLLSKSGPERFGEIILLISSIRCAVKAFYNVTRESDLFNYQLFDQVVRDVLVE